MKNIFITLKHAQNVSIYSATIHVFKLDDIGMSSMGGWLAMNTSVIDMILKPSLFYF